MKTKIDARSSVTVENSWKSKVLCTDTFLVGPIVVVVETHSLFVRIVLGICTTLLYNRYLARNQSDEVSYNFCIILPTLSKKAWATALSGSSALACSS